MEIALYLILLSFIQGMTEFLPVSSSAHLLILPYIINIKDQGVIIDVSAHIGSLLAVCYFYKKDIIDITKSFFSKKCDENKRLSLKLILAFIPIVWFGVIMLVCNISEIRNPQIVIYTSAIFGIVLYCVDLYGSKRKNINELSYKSAILIGLSQILATIPGVSRSGITLTTAMACGQNRASALKFTFLLSIPTIFIVAIGSFIKFIFLMPMPINYSYIILTIVFSFIFSILAIKFILNWVKKSSFKIFAIYRILLAVFLYIFLK